MMREAGYNAGLLRKEIRDPPAAAARRAAAQWWRCLRAGARAGRRALRGRLPGPEAAAVPASADELASEYTGFILAASPVEILGRLAA